jgi:glycosyltransferase involved in cell wall biosynthesis
VPDEPLTNAMLFVLPSDPEGLSLALLDAMGAGLCVLTSDVPENREVVDAAGFTFHRGDVDDLTDGRRILIANSALREAAGKALEEKDSRAVSRGEDRLRHWESRFEIGGLERAVETAKKSIVGAARCETKQDAGRRVG